jgi:hypothetical protein
MIRTAPTVRVSFNEQAFPDVALGARLSTKGTAALTGPGTGLLGRADDDSGHLRTSR